MKIQTKMHYLGKKLGKSKETGNEYYLVKMTDSDDNIFDWYVPMKNNEVLVDIIENKAKKFMEYKVLLELGSYQGKARVDLVGMGE
jgi:hypothetical protein